MTGDLGRVFGGVEGGGTKFMCVIGAGPDHIVDETRFDTTAPAETLGRVAEFFLRPRRGLTIAAVGVASFGPIDPDPSSRTYGRITTTPKPGWADTDVVGALHDRLGIPIGWDTDVNGAALGERRWGAGRGADPLVYVTVGTGIGGGAVMSGQPLHGLMHPEMGHMLIPRVAGDDFPGVCSFHESCLEGLASGPALRGRTGKPAEELRTDDPIWELEAEYLALGLLTIVETVAPQRIVVGGGVGTIEHLLPRVRRHVTRLNHGYIASPSLTDQIDAYIVPPGLGARSGVMGALELARLATL